MSLFRSGGVPVYYGDSRTATSFDVYITATTVAAGILGVAWLCIWPTAKRMRDTIAINFAYALSVFVFVVAIRQDTKKDKTQHK